MPINALDVLCAQLTRDLLAIAKFLFSSERPTKYCSNILQQFSPKLLRNDQLTQVLCVINLFNFDNSRSSV